MLGVPVHPSPFLAALAETLRPLADPLAIQAEATRLLGRRLGASRVLYGEVDDQGRTVVIADGHYVDGAPSMGGRHRLEDFGAPMGQRLRAGATYVLENAEGAGTLDESQRAAYARVGVRSHVTVPLMKEGTLRALLSVSHATPRRWRPEEITLVEQTAERTWDAVERARSQQALRSSEARYRSLFESIDEGFCVVEMLFEADGRPSDYRFVETNRVFERQTGLRDALGRTARELVPGLEPHWFRIYGDVARTGKPVRFVQGSAAMGRWFDVYAFRVGEPDARQVAILFTDITERRQAEAERERLAAQRQLALDAARLGWWRYDPDADATSWDARYKEIFAVQEDGAAGAAWLAPAHPDDLPLLRAALAAALDPAAPRPFTAEYRVRRPDGTIRWIESRGLTAFEDPPPGRRAVSLVGTVADVTERRAAEEALRESERRFRSMADAAPAILWLTEPDGSCSFLSRGWYELTGQTEGEALGLGWMAAVHPDDEGRTRQIFLGANARREPFTLDYRLRRSDGEYRWAADTGRPRFGPDGEFLGFIGSVIDIHDRVRAEEQLRQAAKMEAIGRLAGGVAHDFNNQLHAVSGFAGFVARDPGLGARAHSDLGEIRRATERMAGLTRQLLAFSRRQMLQPETLQLNDAVVEGSSLLRRLIGADVEMVLDLSPEPTWVQVDPAQLLQVLMNLAINARDAMPAGGRLEVRTATRAVGPGERPGGEMVAPGAYVVLSVSDTGTGIAAEHLAHIFEPFFTTKDVGEGTGLGLATVHGIVTQSRGYVWVSSVPDEGTTFTVLLPRVAPGGAASKPGSAVPTSAARPARILVVDDEEIVRGVVSRMLEEQGYEVVQARTGDEALALLRGATADGVDMVLSDVVMPGTSGRELMARLVREHPELPVVWMSGYPRDSILGEPPRPGAAPYLQKPVPEDVLVRTVQETLAERARR